jgi:hypothetical protein
VARGRPKPSSHPRRAARGSRVRRCRVRVPDAGSARRCGWGAGPPHLPVLWIAHGGPRRVTGRVGLNATRVPLPGVASHRAGVSGYLPPCPRALRCLMGMPPAWPATSGVSWDVPGTLDADNPPPLLERVPRRDGALGVRRAANANGGHARSDAGRHPRGPLLGWSSPRFDRQPRPYGAPRDARRRTLSQDVGAWPRDALEWAWKT